MSQEMSTPHDGGAGNRRGRGCGAGLLRGVGRLVELAANAAALVIVARLAPTGKTFPARRSSTVHVLDASYDCSSFVNMPWTPIGRLVPRGSAALGTCPGPLVWFAVGSAETGLDADWLGAILECARCDYIIVTGTLHDARHADTPLIREGLAT